MDIQQEINASINAQNSFGDYSVEIREFLKKQPKTIIVLDDDPTGTQTMFDVPVITDWSEATIENEFKNNTPLFFILTNSRSLQVEEAVVLAKTIGENLQKIAKRYSKEIIVISRGDSTLRGHYPDEVDALGEGLGLTNANHLIVPAFFEGGRYTFKDVHYVKEGDNYIPAAETPFAKDNTFGYNSSNLKKWVEEKTKGRTTSNNVESFSLNLLRSGVENVQQLMETSTKNHFILNATAYADLQIAAFACLKSNKQFLLRTSASFVNAISGINPSALLTKNEIIPNANSNGALVVIGSYVPKTTEQLNYLKKHSNCEFIEVDVQDFIGNNNYSNKIKEFASRIDEKIASNKTVVIYTSRKVIAGNSKEESLTIVNKISSVLVEIVKAIKVKPSYLIAKGGITSSDTAVKGLGVKRANVIGQVIKGVPVWQLGNESKFPSMSYIIFPGNVGDEKSIYTILNNLK